MIDVPVLVKEALREGNTRKNYRFDVYNADESEVDFSIENDNLVKESVRIDERMCSDTNLKFGLCEGTQLEFQCFGVANITNRRLKAYVEVNYINENDVDSWHPVTLGWFTVKECSRQASTGILKVSCYNKLLSDYLDAKANTLIEETISDTGNVNTITLQTLQNYLLEDYQIQPKEEKLLIASSSGGVASEYNDINCSVIGYSGSWHPHIGTGNSFDYEQEYVNGERVKIENLEVYVELLNTVIREIKEAWFAKISNAQTTWDAFKKKFLLMCGITVYIRSDNDYWYEGFYTVEELYRPDNDYTPDSNNQRASAYSILLDNDMKYLKIPFFDDGYPSRELLRFMIPTSVYVYSGGNGVKIWRYKNSDSPVDWRTDCPLLVYTIPSDNIENIEINKTDISDVTLRDLVSANYELHCQYGKLDRETDLFSGVELNNNRLLPADTLYPADDLYPNSMSERANRAMYSKLWADEGNVRSFRYLIITYKGTEVDPDTGTVSEVEKKLQRTVNMHGTDDYNMSDNWLFKNLVWADEDVGDYADAMVEKMRNITWFPFEMWCAGLPYIETGDEVEISVGQNTYTSYVLRRNLKGIQNLQDEMINGTLDIF